MIEAVRAALVTGATSGLGRAVATALAQQGVYVLVHGRDRHRTEALAEELNCIGVGAEPVVADLASLAGVRELALEVRAKQQPLHVLINNAGIGAGQAPYKQRELSAEGYELRLAVNYLAPALLTRLLMPKLAASAPARVVNVGSVGQASVDFRDVDLEVGYGGAEAYFRSKFALAAFTVDLGRSPEVQAAGVNVNCLHPATFMDTKQVTEAGYAPWVPVSAGVGPVLELATGAAGARYSGEFFDGKRRTSAHQGVYDANFRERLRKVTDERLAPFTDQPGA